MDSSLVAHMNVWLEHDNQVVLSEWRVALLEAVGETGSITGAAERMHVPYRVAWKKIREMERGLGVKLVATRTGGSDGGGSALTPTAEQYIERYRSLSAGMAAWLEQRFADSFTP